MVGFDLRTTLYPHQVPAVEKLMRTRVSGLFMDMGTGKSRVSIGLIHRRQRSIDRVIIYCPVSLKLTWRHEILKHTDTRPERIYLFDEHTRSRTLPRADWYVIGIESMGSSNRVALAARDLTTTRTAVIVDESSYIKGHDAKRTQRITAFSRQARYRHILTGTPVSQSIADLFAQMFFLDERILGYRSWYAFAHNHLEFHPDYPGLVVRAHNLPYLTAKMGPYIYQITAEEAGLNLPPKRFHNRYCRLTNEQHDAMWQAKWELLSDVEDFDRYTIFQLFNALQQIASGFWRRDGRVIEYPEKRSELLLSVVEDAGEAEKIVVWTKFRHSLHKLTAVLSAAYGHESVAQYYGDLNERERDCELTRWRQRPSCRFLLATMATGGHGLDLTESAFSIFYESPFKYAVYRQAVARTDRMGQTRPPLYVRTWADCKIEERIAASLSRKGDLVRDFRRQVDALKHLRGKALKEAVAQLL